MPQSPRAQANKEARDAGTAANVAGCRVVTAAQQLVNDRYSPAAKQRLADAIAEGEKAMAKADEKTQEAIDTK
ncbi:hypothetical protein [Spirillospora sp. CA-128828]|uniref:hypothetical protein n=1 Tax=Spirillospora sp. CA-128828 TaxID=3240033 RepID=UPI003D8E5D14